MKKKAALDIVTVVPTEAPLYLDRYSSLRELDHLETSAKKIVEDSARKIKNRCTELQLNIYVVQGKPSREIVELASDLGVDLIVVGNRGSSGIASWMLGNVSREVVEGCTVPVLVVKNERYCGVKTG